MSAYPPLEIVNMIVIYGATDNNAREAPRQYRDKYSDTPIIKRF